jgi:biopolymer transport protein ExbD
MMKMALWYPAACLIVFGLPVVSWAKAAERPLVVMIDRSNGAFIYKVESERVSDDDLVGRLGGIMLRERDPNRPVVVLAHEEASLRSILNVRGMLHKVGFVHIRYFYYERGKQMMAELGLGGRAIPFSANGAAQSSTK